MGWGVHQGISIDIDSVQTPTDRFHHVDRSCLRFSYFQFKQKWNFGDFEDSSIEKKLHRKRLMLTRKQYCANYVTDTFLETQTSSTSLQKNHDRWSGKSQQMQTSDESRNKPQTSFKPQNKPFISCKKTTKKQRFWALSPFIHRISQKNKLL